MSAAETTLAVFIFWYTFQGLAAVCSNCVRCSFEQHCEECQSGFYLEGWYCKKCPPGCKRCSYRGRCTECNTGRFGITCEKDCFNCANNVCDIYSGNCKIGCKTLFAPVEQVDGFRCHACRENCIRCNPRNNLECYTCKRGYWGGFCQHTCPQTCLELSCRKLDGKCDRGCKEGFYPENGDFTRGCNKCHENCLNCRSRNECVQCRNGFWGQNCEAKCGEKCFSQECNKLTGKCNDKCKIGHFLKNNDKCAPCPSLCDFCFSEDTCDTCQSGWYGDKCDKRCSPGCKTCLKTPTTCSECVSGWALYNFTCINQKRICPHGEYLSADGFCQRCQSNCLRCSSTQCLECRENFNVDTSGVCHACPENCTDEMCKTEECKHQHDTSRDKLETGDKHTRTGATVGVVIGCIFAVVFVVIAAVCLIKKRRGSTEPGAQNDDSRTCLNHFTSCFTLVTVRNTIYETLRRGKTQTLPYATVRIQQK